MRYQNIIFVLIAIFTLNACTFDLNIKTKTDHKLHKKYQYSEKADDVAFFYDVVKKDAKKTVVISFKNKSNFYMSGVAMTINARSIVKNRYINLGNIKTNNYKEFIIDVPLSVSEVKLSYEYFLSREDQFMKSESYGGAIDHNFGINEEYKKVGNKVLYLK